MNLIQKKTYKSKMNNSIFKIVLITMLLVNASFCFRGIRHEENNEIIITANETTISTDTDITPNSIFNKFINIDVNEMDKIIMEYNLKRNQNKSKLINQILEKQFEMSENQDDSNQRLKEVSKLIDIQSNILVSMYRSVIKLENKLIFDLQKYSLVSNISIDELLNQGFETVYDQLYSHVTTNQELYNIKKKCNNRDTKICVGGSDGSNKLLLVSCGFCENVLETTELNQPRLMNGAWWYFTPDESFGFAPNSNIRQASVDGFDCDTNNGWKNCKDSQRLSWYLGGGGGWRLGVLNDIANTIPSTYRKIIFLN